MQRFIDFVIRGLVELFVAVTIVATLIGAAVRIFGL
jgi:hypothetical protein